VKQVLALRGGAKTVREVPTPDFAAGDVLVRNLYSVISSGTERSASEQPQQTLVGKALARPELVRQVASQVARDGIRQTRAAIRRRLDSTSAVGYSSAGRVVEVGAAVRGLKPGDLVACAGVGYANHAEVVAVPRNLRAEVPAGVPLQAAALTTIAAVALHGIRLADVRVGDRTAVIGCGLIGQITCRLLRAAGSEVFALDIDPDRVASAGADHGSVVGPQAAAKVLSDSKGVGVDHVLITAAAPSNDPLLLAGEIARDRAEVVIVGDVPIEIPRATLFSKELSVRVSRSYGPGRYDSDYEVHGVDYPIGYVRWTQQRNMECILELQARGQLRLEDLIEDVVPVDESPSAYERLAGPHEDRPRGALAIAYPEPVAPVNVEVPAEPLIPARAEDAVRVGLIGPGDFAGSVIVPALLGAGATLSVVGGGSGRSAEASARGFGFPRVADDADDVISDDGTDAVAICTRHGSHARLVAQALDAGKHVFCEKPLALSIEELEQVMTAAGRADRILSVGFNRRFSPLVVELRGALQSAGTPVAATYRVSAGPMPASHWVHDLEQGGGRILGEVCHFLDTLVFLTGSPVTEVHGTGFSNVGAPVQATDTLAITVRHADGSLGTIAYIAQAAEGIGKERIEAFGNGVIGVLDDFRRLELHGYGAREISNRTQQKGHREEIAAFIDGVRSGRPPVSLGEIANVTLATLAVVESLRTGDPVRVAGD
jgi:predicted dehydrogenase